jgi:hypothetical protein
VDANERKPSIDILTAVEKFFINLQKYQHKESLHDLVVSGMTVKEFWQYGAKDYT